MFWVWLLLGGACVRSVAVEVNYRVTTQWRIKPERGTSGKSVKILWFQRSDNWDRWLRWK